MTNKQWLEHAKRYGYPVSVEWQRGNGHGQEGGIISEIMSNGFKFYNDERKHDYAWMVSVEPLEPVVEKAENVYDYIKRRMGHHTIFADYLKAADYCVRATKVAEILNEAQEKYGGIDSIPDNKPNKSSILDEEWEVELSDQEYWIETEDNEIIATIEAIDKPTRAQQLSAAPDAFRTLVDIVGRCVCEEDLRKPGAHAQHISPGGILACIDVLKKAGIA